MTGQHPAERVARYRAAGAWTDDTIDGIFQTRVAEAPDRLALVDPPNTTTLTGREQRRLTWSELADEVDRMAAVLLSYGIGPGDVVAVQLPNTVELMKTFLAVVRIGAVVMPMPVAFREYELTGMCRRAGAKMFVTTARVGDRNLAAAATVVAAVDCLTALAVFGPAVRVGDDLDRLTAEASPGAAATYASTLDTDPNDRVTICWTSGTEAAPKGVPRCHYDWLSIADACGVTGELSAADVILNPFPMTNMAGIGGMVLPWLQTGGVFVLHQPFEVPVFLRQIAAERVTYTIAPPALLTVLLNNEQMLASTDLSAMRAMGSGSAPLAPSMVRGWQERHGIGVINFFGSNEGCCLLSAPADMADPGQRAEFFPRYNTAGIPGRTRMARQTELKLVDRITGEEITTGGRPGELYLRGPSIFAGYLDQESADPFDEDGFFRTGDVFEIAGESGEFLRFVDRAKDIIIRGGVNIAPAEIEGLLSAHPAVAEVAAVGVPDERLGERVCVVVVPREGATVTLADLVEFLRETKIASYKLPERMELVDSLPRNPVGKIVKRVVRGQFGPSG